MFTGIVETVGAIERIASGERGGRSLVVRSGFDPSSIRIGDSICHDGVCLTVVSIDGPRYTIDAGPETLARTTIGRLRTGSRVNLERSMALGDRIGGHLVQGHVDGVGLVRSVTARENAYDLTIETPLDLAELVAPRGAIAVDGISLTVTGVEAGAFSISIIPHTWKVTTISERTPGSHVNLEADMIARYVARALDARGLTETGTAASRGITRELLEKHGFGS